MASVKDVSDEELPMSPTMEVKENQETPQSSEVQAETDHNQTQKTPQTVAERSPVQPPYHLLPQDKKIFVGGLPDGIADVEFRGYFARFGNVTDSVIIHNRVTRKPRGFGFVTFDSDAAIDRVLQNRFYDLKGKQVEVKIATPKMEANSTASTSIPFNNTHYNHGNHAYQPYYPYGYHHYYAPNPNHVWHINNQNHYNNCYNNYYSYYPYYPASFGPSPSYENGSFSNSSAHDINCPSRYPIHVPNIQSSSTSFAGQDEPSVEEATGSDEQPDEDNSDTNTKDC